MCVLLMISSAMLLCQLELLQYSEISIDQPGIIPHCSIIILRPSYYSKTIHKLC